MKFLTKDCTVGHTMLAVATKEAKSAETNESVLHLETGALVFAHIASTFCDTFFLINHDS